MTKNTFLDNTNGSYQVIHDFYPYIQAVEIPNEEIILENPYEFASMLNQALLNPQLEDLKLEMLDLNYLLDMVEIIMNKNLRMWVDFDSSLQMSIYPSSFYLEKELTKRLNLLKQILEKLESWDLITVRQIQNLFPFNFHPNPSTPSSSSKEGEERVLGFGWTLAKSPAIANWLKSKKEEKNKLASQDKAEIKKQCENYGKAGYIICYVKSEKIRYIKEDENVFKAIKELMYAIIPECSTPYIYTGEYKNDKIVRHLARIHKINGYNVYDYQININTDYKFKNEQIWKETVRKLKEEKK